MSSVQVTLPKLSAATGQLLSSAELSDAAMAAPSLLPGWSRGHVMTHLARNADGGARLLRGARTGVPGYEYESVEARRVAIDEGGGRPASALRDDVRRTADAFAAEASLMTSQAWQQVVRWTTGQRTKADMVPRSRLSEVLIHYVDLASGCRPEDWPAARSPPPGPVEGFERERRCRA